MSVGSKRKKDIGNEMRKKNMKNDKFKDQLI